QRILNPNLPGVSPILGIPQKIYRYVRVRGFSLDSGLSIQFVLSRCHDYRVIRTTNHSVNVTDRLSAWWGCWAVVWCSMKV
uniref:Uncharacterized protein n=1 Tax=Ciona intestinalis TaxID=7719 RepID=H2XQI1_CIOIN